MSKFIRDNKVKEARRLLQNLHAFLNEEGGFAAFDLLPTASQNESSAPRINLSDVLGNHQQDDRFENSDIETIARRVQREMWCRRGEFWPSEAELDPLHILDPAKALAG